MWMASGVASPGFSLASYQLLMRCRWVEEYHVDGFRFDLAACLCRDPHGPPWKPPPSSEKSPQTLSCPRCFLCCRALFCWCAAAAVRMLAMLEGQKHDGGGKTLVLVACLFV